ncbi:MAG: 1-(5-phosphoribosyl)-5-[(5-phosphoribosylamino)methylideneamino] imidazole-4-carboxamide isomerase [Proteobacteria bacterium]|nr:1-(5-phosphoribosyl)-5-[(5-phosphoribosylamino)methylideneamino] imidazole-4-carboxamide isomerase [Pseudomonadota bacterium]MBS0462584.1 1-(5-phosphoribosyl)-5-[(5-phosphoribosylamino)methylideneamino] imidazole-4-carboxamide isomerase [Pseudomonadota bacterium]MBS0463579.1 1-(5-phosphoribosyl)-5-[(5-phosphoribosylamino)methylideneamino] imidazole-4-carboxamide isomerase [Pseudomonadota bacterium]
MSDGSNALEFTVYPAIDVRGGRVVRLRQGDYAQETHYADDPFGVVRLYAQAGAAWLHLVDLDAARMGGYRLAELLLRIKDETGLRVQTGGGVRSEADVRTLLQTGADRVIVGSLAVREPETVRRWLQVFGPERIVVALDTRKDEKGWWRLPTQGWTQTEGDGKDLAGLLVFYATAGLRHLLCTDIDRDGTLAGPNVDLYQRLRLLAPGVAVQASGGVRDLADVRGARAAGCAGVVLGRALLDGRVDLAEALAC